MKNQFQRFCRLECAVEDPNGSLQPDPEEEPLTRTEIFIAWAGRYVAQAAGGKPLTDSLLALTDEEEVLRNQARACIESIIAGDCPLFFINSGQYPRHEKGLITYKAAAKILDEET